MARPPLKLSRLNAKRVFLIASRTLNTKIVAARSS